MEATKSTGTEFHEAMTTARSGDLGVFLTLYTAAEYAGMACFTAHNGTVGGALKDHGDGRVEIVSLFNNGGPRGAGLAMFDHLVSQGGNYAECLGDNLAALYMAKGFAIKETFGWDDEIAAADMPDWDYARFGRPSYHTLFKA